MKQRADVVLSLLEDNGPTVLTMIVEETGFESQAARYALRTLMDEKKAHICAFDQQVCEDGHPHYTATYKAGEGVNKTMPPPPPSPAPDDYTLQFKQTLHLQDIYMEWAATRTPDPLLTEE